MKKDTLLGLLIVIAAVAVVLVIFCWIDGIPAVTRIELLADVMR